MKIRKNLKITVVVLLLGFLMVSSSIRTGQFVSHIWQNAGTLPNNYLRADVASGSPIAMVTKKRKAESILNYRGIHHSQAVLNQLSATTVNAADKDVRLIPGGQSIGVQLSTKGVLVVGYHLIATGGGESSPGETAGIRVGDVITKINGKTMSSITDVRHIMDGSKDGEPLQVTLIRQRSMVKKRLTPIMDTANRQYQMGLFIRDSASGIGTMTFYDPNTGSYGALGHVISDRDTGQPIMVKDGHIVRSIVQAIDRGREGKPGEKIAFFPENAISIGSVSKNTPFGIFGKMEKNYMMRSGMSNAALPIATGDQVKEGPAKILTVLNGNKVEAFNIRILNSISQKHPATKGLVIKITDPRLLKATGGIIQGMSGSPIIQDGKLVGAVTHVFVNDPTSGYGVHIEWMMDEAGLHHEKQALRKRIAS
ncbi:SpoIVB peptidase [Sporolactobacillus nakayamae]|uniref:Stage IV sporulation protein B n=1 Tax=Sporolactobacillus nakayamae TaxID=269670 RepID=A0A1I2VIU9_9BACL|nr:SpoIVB peptidase [Sporolactobacillus nakayamae]SFG89198.1 stage IV sporulation protein B [Sporolactobacillus nakayamae]